jgi:hypothetical protein
MYQFHTIQQFIDVLRVLLLQIVQDWTLVARDRHLATGLVHVLVQGINSVNATSPSNQHNLLGIIPIRASGTKKRASSIVMTLPERRVQRELVTDFLTL